MSELLLGCGASRAKRMGGRAEWSGLTTLDSNPDHKPDVVWDLNEGELPFADETFDEIHAYCVLEHLGRQGDWRFFFDQWSDFWRVLKPGGMFFGICPAASSPWAWGDPSHTRIIGPECLIFLHQPAYEQVGQSPMSDFRFIYRADFDHVHSHTVGHHFEFVLQAVKPSRVAIA